MFGNKGILQELPEQSGSTLNAIMENQYHMYLSSADDLRFNFFKKNCDNMEELNAQSSIFFFSQTTQESYVSYH
jgi:hypothetical protein